MNSYVFQNRGSLGSFFGAVVRTVGRVVPGPVGGLIGLAGDRLPGGSRAPQIAAPSFNLQPALSGGPGTSLVRPGGGGGVVGRVSPLGTVGTCPTEIVYTKSGHARRYRLKKGGGCTWHKRPSMNVLNPHAAHKAITRIKGAMHMLHQIQAQLPKRHTRGASARRGKSCGCR